MSMPERVIVAGGRDYEDEAVVFAALDTLAEVRVIDTVIQGDCPTGADRLARKWAILRNHNLARYPADWKAHGRAAGPIRNQQMIDEGRPTRVMTFPGGRGTADMVRRAKAAGLPVNLIGQAGMRGEGR